jgi:chromosome segregation ATPase
MKFETFYKIRQSLKENGILSESVSSYEEYSSLFSTAVIHQQVAESIDKEMDRIELSIACLEEIQIDEARDSGSNIFSTIISYMRIKSMAAKYIRAMVDEGVNDMDYYRRRAAARKAGKDSAETENLKVAHQTKADALTDRVKAIADRIDTIAGSSEFLNRAAQKVKTTGRIKKNEILIKIASKEEAKELKLKNAELNKDLVTIDNELRDYQSDNKDEIEKAVKEQMDKVKGQIDDIKGKIDGIEDKITEVDAESPEAKSEKAEALKKIIELKIKKAEMLEKQIELETQYNQLKKTEDEDAEDEYDVENATEKLESLKDDIKDQAKEAEKLAAEAGDDETTTPEKGEGEGDTETTTDDNTTPEKGEGDTETTTDDKQKEKEKAFKKEQAQKKLESAKKKLQTAKDEGKSEEIIKKIQANIDGLQAKLDGLSESVEDFEMNLIGIDEAIDNVLSMIEALNEPRGSFVTFTQFVANRK